MLFFISCSIIYEWLLTAIIHVNTVFPPQFWFAFWSMNEEFGNIWMKHELVDVLIYINSHSEMTFISHPGTGCGYHA